MTCSASAMSILLRHRLQLPLLLAVLVIACHGDDPSGDTYNTSICQTQAYTCGEVEIRYPFYLSGVSGEVRGNSSFCGYPGLEIACDDGTKPTLRLNDTDYSVTGIDYSNYTISLVDPDVLKNESCPRIDHNVTLPSNVFLNFTESTVRFLLFATGCPSLTFSNQANITAIDCGGNSSTGGYSFVIPWELPHGLLFEYCQQVFLVPVLQGAPFQIDQQWSTGGYGNILAQGFQLEWELSRRSNSCTKCDNSNGRCSYNQYGEFVGCLCANGQAKDQECPKGHQKGYKIYIIASTWSLLTCLFILAFFVVHNRNYGWLSINRKPAKEWKPESFLQNGNLHTKRYTYVEVKRMTISFSVKLGQGGFGDVYRGNLSDGRQVAVKMLKESKGDGEDFMNEVASISRTSHVNVVMLLGFCLQGSKRALIYEYMPNGSLDRYAFNSNFKCENTLPWEKLFDIAIGIARGLEYLHRGCNTRIVHFDIKPHNILLDQDFCPKISDFGLAKLCLNKESALSVVGARGTIGYIAPEVYSKRFGTISSKSDVYSYGMMVLEMVGARDKNISAHSESSSQYFPQWIYEHLDDYCISASEINGETTELVRKMILVGLWCIQVVPAHRPTMTRVVEMLEGNTSNLELPPKVTLI